jgi:methylase of polypeptide subunit release factors
MPPELLGAPHHPSAHLHATVSQGDIAQTSTTYVHGYTPREAQRLLDQAGTLAELLHHDTAYPPGSRVLEAGCGVGAQTVELARRSPGAEITAVDISSESLAAGERWALVR